MLHRVCKINFLAVYSGPYHENHMPRGTTRTIAVVSNVGGVVGGLLGMGRRLWRSLHALAWHADAQGELHRNVRGKHHIGYTIVIASRAGPWGYLSHSIPHQLSQFSRGNAELGRGKRACQSIDQRMLTGNAHEMRNKN